MSYLIAGLLGLFAAALIIVVLEIHDRIVAARERAADARRKDLEAAERRGYHRAIDNAQGAFVTDLLAMIARHGAVDVNIVARPDSGVGIYFRQTVTRPARLRRPATPFRIDAPVPDYERIPGESRTLGAQFHVSRDVLRLMIEPNASHHINNEVRRAVVALEREAERVLRETEA